MGRVPSGQDVAERPPPSPRPDAIADASVTVALPALDLLRARDPAGAFFGSDAACWDDVVLGLDAVDRAALEAALVGEPGMATLQLVFDRPGARRVAVARVVRAPGVATVLCFDVTALDATRAHERSQARRAEVLASVAARIAREPDLSVIGEEVCSEVVRALPVAGATLRVHDPATDTFVAVAAAGTNAPLMRPLARSTVDAFIARFGRAAFVRDLPGDPIYAVEPEYFGAIDLKSVLYAAIVRRDQVLGVITASSFGARTAVTPEDVDLLRAIADHVALALANAQVLAESRAAATRYRTIVDTAAEGIVIVDPDYVIRFANPQLARMIGREVSEIEGTRVVDHVFPEDADVPPKLMRERLAGFMGPTRWRLRAKDGHAVEVVTKAAPIREGDAVVALVVIVTDVTASTRLEERLQHAQKLESLALLAGGIAHDFNNLLAAVMGNAGLARARLDPSSPARQCVDDIEQAAQRAADLTRQLLAYTGKGRVDVAPIDLGQLVTEMGQLLTAVVGKGVVLRYELAPSLPRVEGDATQLRQIVMNLITNASDAIGDRDGVITIAARLLHADEVRLAATYLDDGLTPGDYVALEVRDDGAGMSRETRARIFDPFFTTKVSGRGLGLAATLGILRAHRGTIEVTSEPGAGSTFCVLLPASDAKSRPAAARAARPATRGGVILVVDDEARVRSVTKAALEIDGYEVLEAADGLEAIEVLRANVARVRLVVLDLTMPRMGGAEAFPELRRLAPALPILVVSGYDERSSGLFAKGELAGFLEKPFTLDALQAAVAEALGAR